MINESFENHTCMMCMAWFVEMVGNLGFTTIVWGIRLKSIIDHNPRPVVNALLSLKLFIDTLK